MRREDVNAIKEGGAANDAFQGITDLAADFSSVIEPALAVFHFPAKIRAGVEPESCSVQSLIARSIEIMQAVRKTVKRIAIYRR